MSKIGDAITRRRRASGMTTKALAEAVPLSQQYMVDIQMGRRCPPSGTLLKIANVFPDVDAAAWLWLLLASVWGSPIADLMQAWVLAEHRVADGAGATGEGRR
mgnify:CR=1 FL=1